MLVILLLKMIKNIKKIMDLSSSELVYKEKKMGVIFKILF